VPWRSSGRAYSNKSPIPFFGQGGQAFTCLAGILVEFRCRKHLQGSNGDWRQQPRESLDLNSHRGRFFVKVRDRESKYQLRCNSTVIGVVAVARGNRDVTGLFVEIFRKKVFFLAPKSRRLQNRMV